jgi:hypothetical protein
LLVNTSTVSTEAEETAVDDDDNGGCGDAGENMVGVIATSKSSVFVAVFVVTAPKAAAVVCAAVAVGTGEYNASEADSFRGPEAGEFPGKDLVGAPVGGISENKACRRDKSDRKCCAETSMTPNCRAKEHASAFMV